VTVLEIWPGIPKSSGGSKALYKAPNALATWWD
jgi:hypothetical protein